MGNFVYINIGLMKASDNEAQLASVTLAFFSTHPSPPDRVQRLNSMIPPQFRAKTDGLDQNNYKQRVQYFFR